MTEDDIFDLYRKKFIPIYADFVALTTIKPQQILIEQENILAHLSQHRNKDLGDEMREENLQKAYNHMVRVTLDMHKLVWAELRAKLEPFALDGKKRLAFNTPEHNVLNMFSDFMNHARDARHFEMKHVGNNPIGAIEKYGAANAAGNNLLAQLDDVKAATVSKWTRVFTSRDFVIGVAASLTASGLIAGIVFFLS
jgi:hypothetical protein